MITLNTCNCKEGEEGLDRGEVLDFMGLWLHSTPVIVRRVRWGDDKGEREGGEGGERGEMSDGCWGGVLLFMGL